MCVCRQVLYVSNTYYMLQVSTLWVCVIGRYKMVTYVTSTFSGFFLIICPSCMSIILILLVIFNCMYRGFLDLVWLWCIICSLEHEFVIFNKPYLCFFFFFTHGRMMLKIMSLPSLLQKDPVLFGAPILSIVWVFCLLFNKLIVKTMFLKCL